METTIESLGPCQIVSPLTHNSFEVRFRSDSERVLYDHLTETATPSQRDLSFELAGPRERLFFDPSKTTAAIVTCGGLCPGLNVVIR
jgi:6-phosphofructokinase 1